MPESIVVVSRLVDDDRSIEILRGVATATYQSVPLEFVNERATIPFQVAFEEARELVIRAFAAQGDDWEDYFRVLRP